MTPRYFLLIVLLALCSPWTSPTSQAEGGMLLNRSIVVFKPGQPPRQDATILNQEDENLYINIEILEVRNPGTEQEERVKVTDPGQSKLIVTPNRLIIPPRGRKAVRMVNLEPSDEERIYRVNVTPVLPPLEDPKTSLLRIVVAYQLLVIVQPRQPVENLQVTRSGRQLVFENRGNTNVLISEGTQCESTGNSCEELPTKRIYAGNRFEVSLTHDSAASYKLTAGEESRQTVYE